MSLSWTYSGLLYNFSKPVQKRTSIQFSEFILKMCFVQLVLNKLLCEFRTILLLIIDTIVAMKLRKIIPLLQLITELMLPCHIRWTISSNWTQVYGPLVITAVKVQGHCRRHIVWPPTRLKLSGIHFYAIIYHYNSHKHHEGWWTECLFWLIFSTKMARRAAYLLLFTLLNCPPMTQISQGIRP